MSRVRVPRGALSSIDFVDIRAMGLVLFYFLAYIVLNVVIEGASEGSYLC